jgi:hypothetical protein
MDADGRSYFTGWRGALFASLVDRSAQHNNKFQPPNSQGAVGEREPASSGRVN